MTQRNLGTFISGVFAGTFHFVDHIPYFSRLTKNTYKKTLTARNREPEVIQNYFRVLGLGFCTTLYLPSWIHKGSLMWLWLNMKVALQTQLLRYIFEFVLLFI